jgi:hypothetical protein
MEFNKKSNANSNSNVVIIVESYFDIKKVALKLLSKIELIYSKQTTMNEPVAKPNQVGVTLKQLQFIPIFLSIFSCFNSLPMSKGLRQFFVRDMVALLL